MRRLILGLALLAAAPAARAQTAREPVTVHKKHFEVVARDEKVAQAQGRMLQKAAARFKELLGSYPPRGKVTLLRAGSGARSAVNTFLPPPPGASESDFGKTVWTLQWFDPPRNWTPSTPDLMTHEAGHLMFTHWVAPRLKPTQLVRKDRYASRLPDWLDEAIAVWGETDYMRRVRRIQVRQRLGRHYPLAKLFASEHPLAEELSQNKATPAVFNKKAETLTLYYGQSYSVLEYLRVAGKVKFVRAMIDGLAEGKTMDQVLGALSNRSLRTVAGFERGWVGWVRRSYPRR